MRYLSRLALVPMLLVGCVTGAADDTDQEERSAEAITTGTYYVFEARHSGKALDVTSSSTADGGNVQQWSKNGTGAQQWRFDAAGDGYYVIRSRASGKALDVQDRSMNEGANVQQWGYGGGTNQQWRLEDAGGGYYRVRARHSGMYLDVAWGSAADGANVAAVKWYPSNAQQWKLTAAGAAPAPTPTPAPSGYRLVWSDEFDRDGLPDGSKWTYDVGGNGWGNNEEQFYTDRRAENARVEGGRLIIEARRENYGGRPYTSARLKSKDAGNWLYGRFEARAKIPRARGTWPAIWMLPTDWKYGGWPHSGEIDIMEHVGWDPTIFHGSVHTGAYNHTIGTQKTARTQITDAFDQFHVYACEWTPENVSVIVDGRTYFSFANEHAGSARWPFDQRFHMILNIAVGGAWGGVQGIDEGAFPQRMEVDYVRAYQR